MTSYVLASVIFLGGIITATLGELVNEEIRGWLDYLPRLILRLAAARLDPAGKITIYEDEWLPELACILRGAEARPISRLIIGVKFSAGLLITAKRIARHLHRTPSPAQSGLPQPAPASAAEVAPASGRRQFLTARLNEVHLEHALIAEEVESARGELDYAQFAHADAATRERAESSERADTTYLLYVARNRLSKAHAELRSVMRLSLELEHELVSLFPMGEAGGTAR